MAELKDANTNPWYVLMTLYGEQTSDLSFDEREALHAKNRAVWNAWACQTLSDEDAAKVAAAAGVDVGETRGWADIASDVADRFQAEMVKRNGDGSQDRRLPDPEDTVDCREIQFFNTVVLKNWIFTQSAYFNRATFTQSADFSDATFTQSASFIGATFTQSASFSGATFTQSADFIAATFTQSADFSDAIFTQSAYFTRATFTQSASFSGATFTQSASFIGATFTQSASFSDATFTQDAFFGGATFSGFVRMQKAKFGALGNAAHVAYFTDCQFEKPTSFRDAAFLSSYPVFTGAVLHENTDFSAEAALWPTMAQPDPKAARESCATIRHAVDKQGLPEDAHFFFRREMQFAGQAAGVGAGLPYRVFGLVSDYGHSIARPLVALFVLWVVPALIFKGVLDADTMHADRFGNAFEAMGFSFSNIFKFFGFQGTYFSAQYFETLAAPLKLLTALQTVFGFILLFFLGLGLRIRFRMR